MPELPPLEPTGEDLALLTDPELPQSIQAFVLAAYRQGRAVGRNEALAEVQELLADTTAEVTMKLALSAIMRKPT